MTRLIACALFVAGCAHARPAEYRGSLTVTSPELIAVNPEVKTVADADKPLIFAAGSYWLFHDGHWYQGRSIRGPWLLAEKLPVPVAQIDQPYALTHYVTDHPTQTTPPPPQQPQREPEPPPTLQPPRRSSLLEFPK